MNSLSEGLRELKLKSFLKHYEKVAQKCESSNQAFIQYLEELVSLEIELRHHQKISRLIKLAKLPRKKSLENFDITRIKGLSKTLIQTLAKGEFIDKHENILIFGNPGTGKTHLAIALAEEWCVSGYKVLFITAAALMQELLKAKSEFKLNQYMKKIDKYEMLIIDDISYIPCSKEESDVLFNLLSQRYEMKSCLITSNIALSKWNQIFKDEVTTAAVIDRLIHHANILELNTTSYRIENAKNLNKK